MSSQQKTENLVKDLQILEQNLQHILIEKQSLEVDFNEINNALSELKNTKDEVYKILGNIMIKSDKNILIKDLEDKKKIAELKIKSLDSQEKSIEQKIISSRKDLSSEISKVKN